MSATGPEEWLDFGCLSCIRWEGVYLGAASRAYGRELQRLCTDMVPRHQSSERWVLFSEPTAQPGQARNQDRDFPEVAGVPASWKGQCRRGQDPCHSRHTLFTGLTTASKQLTAVAPN